MSIHLVPPAHSTESSTKSLVSTATEHGVHDTFRHGPRSLHSEISSNHAFENRLAKWDETQDALHLNLARRSFGIHAPIKLLMERQIVAKTESGRLPVLASSNIGLDILMGKDEMIDFEDFLTDAGSTDILDVHTAMEQKLGMKL